MGVAVHEIGHAVKDNGLVDREQDEPVLRRAMEQGELTADNVFVPGLPKWWLHGADYIRVALHAHHRAGEPGLLAADVIETSNYDLSPTGDYVAALGDEFQLLQHLALSEIQCVRPPATFARLWRRHLEQGGPKSES